MLTSLALLTILALPADLLGEWRYTSIRGTTFWDSSTGAYLGHGGGNSDTIVIGKDGTFKEYVYMENSPSAGWTTKIFTTTEGRVEIQGDTLHFIATKGHYKTEDNRVARYNIDRDMKESELKKMEKSYRFTLKSDGGKPSLTFSFEDKSTRRYERVR